MRRTDRRQIVAALCVALATLGIGQAASADQPRAEALAALDQLDAWLEGSPQEAGWRKYLKLDALRENLAKEGDADAVHLVAILKRFESDQPGLDRPRFVAVQKALAKRCAHINWANVIPNVPVPEGTLLIDRSKLVSRVAVSEDDAESLDLPELARKYRNATLTIDKSTDALAQMALAEKIADLDKFLSRGGANGQGWKNFLHFPELQSNLSPGNEADLAALEKSYSQFASGEAGLERKRFLDARRALRRFIDLASTRANPQAQTQAEGQLDALAKEFETFADSPDPELARTIGRRLGYLHRIGQADGLIDAARQKYCKPNLFVTARHPFLAIGFEQPVDETIEVNETILGTDIHGPAHTTGAVRLQLIPSSDRAVFQTVMQGRSLSDTVGYNGPVTIYSSGVTDLRAVKQITLDADGFLAVTAKGEATTKSTIHDIQPNRCGIGSRMIQKMAWKKAGKQKCLAEQIASQRAAARLEGRVDSQAAEMLDKSNRRFRENFLNPLLRLDEFPETLDFSTTDEALSVVWMKANIHQLGATTAAPATSDSAVVSIRLHQSLVENLGNALLAGRTLTEEKLQVRLKDLLGEVPEKLRPKADEEPWSITFAAVDPVTIEFKESGYRITVRGQEFTSGERKFKAMNVSAEYKGERSGNGLKWVRQGDLEVNPPGYQPGTPLSAQQIALRTLLVKKFSNIFEAEVANDGLKLGGRWESLGPLPIEQFQCDDGWLALGWRLP